MSEQVDTELASMNSVGELSAETQLQNVGKTESKTSGRMRLRVHSEMRTPETMAQIKENLEQHPDIDDVQVNVRTGSVVIKHSGEHDSHKLFWEAISEVDLIGEAALELPAEDGGEEPTERIEKQLADLSYNIDRAIYKRTGENLHLGLLIPASIAGIGIAQIAMFGIGLELLPGPILLWIAYDIYRRIGKEPPFITHEKDSSTEIEPAADTNEPLDKVGAQIKPAVA
ncbi:MAG: hypothetical protein KDE48_20540 [Anaerolineales bacterium]|nr:hypothetical protein [Anaerolineales bacterium]